MNWEKHIEKIEGLDYVYWICNGDNDTVLAIVSDPFDTEHMFQCNILSRDFSHCENMYNAKSLDEAKHWFETYRTQSHQQYNSFQMF